MELLLLLLSSSPSPSSTQLIFVADRHRDWCCRIAVHNPSNNASSFLRSHPSARSRRVWAVWCRCTPATQVHRGPGKKCCGTPRTSWISTSPPSDGQYCDLERTYPDVYIHWDTSRTTLAPCRFDMNKSVGRAVKRFALKNWVSAC